MSKPARLAIRTDADRVTARKWIDRVPHGWTLHFKPPTRSTLSNARLWAFLDDIAAQKQWNGKAYPSEAWKDLFSACLRQQEIVPGLEGGIVALGARTSEMSPEEMSDLLQLIETWGTQNNVIFTDQHKLSGSSTESGGEARADGSGLASPPQRGVP